MEVHADRMVNHFKVVQIRTFRKLILAFHIYIVHQDILVRTYQRENAGAFYRLLRLLLVIFRFFPLSGGQRSSRSFLDTVAVSFRFIEQMVKSVFVDDVSVNAGLFILRNKQGLRFPSISVKSLLAYA